MKPRLVQGTRDFGYQELAKRYYIADIIKFFFEKYGYKPLETPAFEYLDTLMGKYGMEGDKLIFKILNNGLQDKKDNKLAEVETAWATHLANGILSEVLTERALRYDLTIPFARYVSMNRETLSFPFKRYQLQTVWRADRPQKGRYREFNQCDADVIGSRSLVYEGELLCIYDSVFSRLNIPQVQICINNRKILSALTQQFGLGDKFTEFTVIIDKIDKIGIDKVGEELMAIGLAAEHFEKFTQLIASQKSNEDQLQDLSDYLQGNEEGLLGIKELKESLSFAQALKGEDFYSELKIDLSLARGLDYYTGLIVEVKTTAVSSGSIGGGGRYDNLTGAFGFPDMSGVGVSFGLDRIYNVVEELGLFPSKLSDAEDLLIYISPELIDEDMLRWIGQWRDEGVDFDLLVDQMKIDKVYKIAEKKGIQNVCIIYADNITNTTLKVKNITTGEIKELLFTQLINNYTHEKF